MLCNAPRSPRARAISLSAVVPPIVVSSAVTTASAISVAVISFVVITASPSAAFIVLSATIAGPAPILTPIATAVIAASVSVSPRLAPASPARRVPATVRRVSRGGTDIDRSDQADATRMNGLQGIAVDVKRNFVYVADQGNHRIRRVSFPAETPASK